MVVDLHDKPTVDFVVVSCLAYRFYVGKNWFKWIWLGKNLVIAPRAPKLDIFLLKNLPQSSFFGVHLHKFGALAHVSTEDKDLLVINLADDWTELPREQLTNLFRIDWLPPDVAIVEVEDFNGAVSWFLFFVFHFCGWDASEDVKFAWGEHTTVALPLEIHVRYAIAKFLAL